ncbi:tRNA wybutosine-synthesizing protein [Ophiocordyceps camponoti-floridani]|uniref:tRNA(Phe) 7-[(3-amino-3-carboxypropyl)-4-demethylwyosine(37)-N(4)]-methyltransferase n=1 Tax=Ophiocordyceps camponoti-floridani TaxID=2030778 RepID=A0A8H4QDC7_9HYPO|nr:tRNA wybutosine-synthesizing protein [Ophiocordyceps camponoti-floridani]
MRPHSQRHLPDPTRSFREKKTRILQQLAVPDGEYTDASPKGSVDEAIRPLIDDINRVEGFVTTSSCAGRISVFLEGCKAPPAAGDEPRAQTAGVGGKGAGGKWLFVSHETVARQEAWVDALGFAEDAAGVGRGDRLIHFKFEPMILHVLTTSPAHAQLLLRAGLQAGFRESGAINIEPAHDDEQPATPTVAIRSQGLALESLIGSQAQDGSRRRLVSTDYLETLRAIAAERFVDNASRIDRFRAAFLGAVGGPSVAAVGWEDAATRRKRMREEGLRRRGALAEARDGHESFCGNDAGLDGHDVSWLMEDE